jgi:hypothetical protein
VTGKGILYYKKLMEPKKPGGMKAAYGIAYNKAAAEILSKDQGGLAELCERCGAVLNGGTICLSFFGERAEIILPRQEGGLAFHPEDLSLIERILLLHYLLARESRTTKGAMVAFKNLPGAFVYEPTYRKRGPGRIARRFGEDIETFHRACGNLGWQEAELGDASYQFDIFPKIRGLVVLYAADEEFPAEANLLFNDEIINFLPLEDIAVLAGLIATRLAKSLKL